MRVAALYDVHGNLPALEAVLEEIEGKGIDTIVFGGDIASGPLPRETVGFVRSLDAICVRGNADRLDSPAMSPEWDGARRWVEQQLDQEQIEWLANLDFSAVIDDVLYVHATPQDNETVVTELTPDDRLAALLAGVKQRLVVAGHTHMQHDRVVGPTRFVNAGSVGLPYESRPGAYWAIIGEDVEFRRTAYDLERAAGAIRATSYPMAAEIATENILEVPSRAEALAAFGG